MFIVWWLPAFYYLSKAVALAVPHTLDSANLPSGIRSLLSSCGRHCVATSINFGWPSDVCGSTDNLSCLCTTRSKTGYTLGEIIVQCLVTACPQTFSKGNETLLQGPYNICTNQSGNLPNTHPTLTATIPQSARITTVSSTPDITRLTTRPTGVLSTRIVSPATLTSSSSTAISSSTTGSSSSVLRSHQSSSTHKSMVSLSRTITQRITTSSTSSPTSGVEPTTSSSITSQQGPYPTSLPVASSRRQLKGVKVAAIIIGSLVVVCILFAMVMIFLRQRRKGRRSRDDTSGFNILPSPSSAVDTGKVKQARVGSFPNRTNGPSTGPVTRTLPVAPMKRVQQSSHLPGLNPDQIGVAVSLDSNKSLPQTPRVSSGSPSRSNSRLLPDKPVYKPLSPVAPRPFSDATEFDEDVMSMYGSSSSDTSLDWATAYYTNNFDPDEHLRGVQYAREMGNLPAISRPNPVANPRGWDSSRPTHLRSPIGMRNGRRRESIVQGFPHPPRGTWARQPDTTTTTTRHTPYTPTPKPLKFCNDSSKENISPTPSSSSNLRYPTIPPSLSTTPSLQPTKGNPTRPSLPPRNDTYARNEDLVIATSQALEEITGCSPNLLLEQVERDARLRQLHLSDEVERARQGLEVMRRRAATAAARIQNAQAMGLPSGPRPVV